MRFELKAKVTKQLWTNQQSWLYEVQEIESQKNGKWAVFTNQELNPDSLYFLSGLVSNGKTKKLDINNKPIWDKNFNVDTIKEESSEEINF